MNKSQQPIFSPIPQKPGHRRAESRSTSDGRAAAQSQPSSPQQQRPQAQSAHPAASSRQTDSPTYASDAIYERKRKKSGAGRTARKIPQAILGFLIPIAFIVGTIYTFISYAGGFPEWSFDSQEQQVAMQELIDQRNSVQEQIDAAKLDINAPDSVLDELTVARDELDETIGDAKAAPAQKMFSMCGAIPAWAFFILWAVLAIWNNISYKEDNIVSISIRAGFAIVNLFIGTQIIDFFLSSAKNMEMGVFLIVLLIVTGIAILGGGTAATVTTITRDRDGEVISIEKRNVED